MLSAGLFFQIFNDLLPGQNAAQGVLTVHHGDEILLLEQGDDVLFRGVDGQGGAEIIPQDIPEGAFLHGLPVTGAGLHDVAEKPPLGDAAGISLPGVQHGERRVAVAQHDLQRLPDGLAVVQEHGHDLWDHNSGDVHAIPPV